MLTGQDIWGAQHNLPNNEFHQLVETLTAMIIQSLM